MPLKPGFGRTDVGFGLGQWVHADEAPPRTGGEKRLGSDLRGALGQEIDGIRRSLRQLHTSQTEGGALGQEIDGIRRSLRQLHTSQTEAVGDVTGQTAENPGIAATGAGHAKKAQTLAERKTSTSLEAAAVLEPHQERGGLGTLTTQLPPAPPAPDTLPRPRTEPDESPVASAPRSLANPAAACGPPRGRGGGGGGGAKGRSGSSGGDGAGATEEARSAGGASTSSKGGGGGEGEGAGDSNQQEPVSQESSSDSDQEDVRRRVPAALKKRAAAPKRTPKREASSSSSSEDIAKEAEASSADTSRRSAVAGARVAWSSGKKSQQAAGDMLARQQERRNGKVPASPGKARAVNARVTATAVEGGASSSDSSEVQVKATRAAGQPQARKVRREETSSSSDDSAGKATTTSTRGGRPRLGRSKTERGSASSSSSSSRGTPEAAVSPSQRSRSPLLQAGVTSPNPVPSTGSPKPDVPPSGPLSNPQPPGAAARPPPASGSCRSPAPWPGPRLGPASVHTPGPEPEVQAIGGPPPWSLRWLQGAGRGTSQHHSVDGVDGQGLDVDVHVGAESCLNWEEEAELWRELGAVEEQLADAETSLSHTLGPAPALERTNWEEANDPEPSLLTFPAGRAGPVTAADAAVVSAAVSAAAAAATRARERAAFQNENQSVVYPRARRLHSEQQAVVHWTESPAAGREPEALPDFAATRHPPLYLTRTRSAEIRAKTPPQPSSRLKAALPGPPAFGSSPSSAVAPAPAPSPLPPQASTSSVSCAACPASYFSSSSGPKGRGRGGKAELPARSPVTSRPLAGPSWSGRAPPGLPAEAAASRGMLRPRPRGHWPVARVAPSPAPKAVAVTPRGGSDRKPALPRTRSSGSRVYMGFRNVRGEREGYGVMRGQDGMIYAGQWFASRRDGQGTLFFDGGVFEGQWAAGSAQGKGLVHFKNGDIFAGDYSNNQKCGRGVYRWADGAEEAGEYVDGHKDGWHKWRFQSEEWELLYARGTVVIARRAAGASDGAGEAGRSGTATALPSSEAKT